MSDIMTLEEVMYKKYTNYNMKYEKGGSKC